MNRYFLDDQKAPLKKLIWQIFFVFFFVYEVQPFGVPDMLTSRKIVFYIAGFTFITRFLKRFNSKTFDDVNFKRTSKKLISIGFVVFLWQTLITLLHSGTGSGQPMWGKTLLFLLLTSFFCTFSYFFFNNIKQFLLAMFYATVIQSVICIADFFSFEVKVFLYNHFMVDANFGYLSSSRAYGLGAAESLLAINLFWGLVPTAILIIGCSKNVFYILGYIAILFAALLVGSTGFILGILLLILTIGLVFIYGSFYQKSSLAIIGTVGFFILFSLAAVFFSDIEEFGNFHKILAFQEVGIENQNTVHTLREQAVAPICLHTLLGTSYYRGTVDGLTTMSDTGYLQSYFGNGLILTLVFYFYLYRLMFINVRYIKNRVICILLGFLFLSIVFAEGKEPYIYHYGNTFVFFLACFLSNKPHKQLIK